MATFEDIGKRYEQGEGARERAAEAQKAAEERLQEEREECKAAA